MTITFVSFRDNVFTWLIFNYYMYKSLLVRV